MSAWALGLLAWLTASCTTARATNLPLPRERATECVELCGKLEMRLSAVVVIMSSTGCVCEPTKQDSASPSAGGATVAGGAAIAQAAAAAAAQAAAVQQQQQQQQQFMHR